MTRAEYEQRIWTFLHNMKPGTIEELEFLPKRIIPTQIAKAFFVDIVKKFIDQDGGRDAGFYVEFNNAYEKIKKFAYIVSKAPEPEVQPEGRSLPDGAVLKPEAINPIEV